MQQYHLGLLRFARIFGLVFAAGSVLAIASNIPALVRGDISGLAGTNDGQGLPIAFAVGVGFPAIGVLMLILSGRALKQYRAYVVDLSATKTCQICRRPLDVETDPLSEDCGGDCWGCVGACEMDWEPSAARIRQEIQDGLRNTNGLPKEPVILGEAKRTRDQRLSAALPRAGPFSSPAARGRWRDANTHRDGGGVMRRRTPPPSRRC
jgi:hypothetical protein